MRKLKPLKSRLTPAQAEARQHRMTSRHEMAKTLATHVGGINAAHQGVMVVYKKQKAQTRVVYALVAAVVALGAFAVYLALTLPR